MIADKLRKLRQNCGATQEEVAAACGIARHTYARYEIGVRYPASRIIGKLAHYFGTTVEELTDETLDEVSAEKRTDGHYDEKCTDDEEAAENVMQQIVRLLAGLNEEQLKKAKSYLTFLAHEDRFL